MTEISEAWRNFLLLAEDVYRQEVEARHDLQGRKRMLLDEDGYPTDEALDRIRNWGTEDLGSLIDLIWDVWNNFNCGFLLRDKVEDEDGRSYRELSLATGGWSGNESIVAALRANTMFHLLYWQSSHRGGLHIYRITSPKGN